MERAARRGVKPAHAKTFRSHGIYDVCELLGHALPQPSSAWVLNSPPPQFEGIGLVRGLVEVVVVVVRVGLGDGLG